MLNWISSLGTSKNTIVQVKGSLIEVEPGKKPITVVNDGTAVIDKSKSRSAFDHALMVIDGEETFEWDLDEALEFSAIVGNQKAFGWRDTEDFNRWFVFRMVDDESLEFQADLFRNMSIACIYENQTQTSASKKDIHDIEDEVLGELELDFDIDTLVPLAKRATPSPKVAPPTESVYPKVYPERPTIKQPEYFDNEEEVSRARGDFFMLEPGSDVFLSKATGVVANLVRVGPAKMFTYFLNIELNDERIFQQKVDSMSQMQFYQEHSSVIWSRYDTTISTWSIVFNNPESETDFKRHLSMTRYEMLNMLPWSKVKEEDQDMIFNSYQMDVMDTDETYMEDDFMTFDDDVQMADPYAEEDEEEDEEDEEEDEEDEEQDASASNKASTRDKNSLLADSTRHQRSFVVRGNNIGVFARDSDDVQYDTSIQSLKNEHGDDLVPSNIMLHKGERDMLLTHKNQNDKHHRGRVYQLDIEKEKIVKEWTAFEDYVPVQRTAPVYKYANLDDTQLFSVLNSNAFFGMDPRTNQKNKVIGDINKFTHASNPDFSCVSTSKNGFVAIGSSKGEIRMLSGVPGLPKKNQSGSHPKNAKTLLPGFGDPIKGIDITGDGKWILATCTNYLLLIDTTMPTDSHKTGFEERMGKHKPSPRRLQLLPKDQVNLRGEINFSPAQFNTGSDGEMWIVTSTGSFIVTWNFRKASRNQLTDYTMKHVDGLVVDESFLNMGNLAPGRNAPIVVIMPDDVKLEKRKKVTKNPYHKMPTTYKLFDFRFNDSMYASQKEIPRIHP